MNVELRVDRGLNLGERTMPARVRGMVEDLRRWDDTTQKSVTGRELRHPEIQVLAVLKDPLRSAIPVSIYPA